MYLFFRMLVELWYRHIRFRTTILNVGNIPREKGGFIVASNHQKYDDPPMIAAIFRGRFSFMAKSELFEKNKLFAWLIRKCGAYPVVRGGKDTAAIDRAVKELRMKRIFVIFPEGTRSKTGELGRGKSGVAIIAGQSGAPVVPVCIMYAPDGKKHHAVVAVGKKIPAEQLKIDDPTDRKQLKAVSKLIMDSIAKLQRQICEHYDIPLPGTVKEADEEAPTEEPVHEPVQKPEEEPVQEPEKEPVQEPEAEPEQEAEQEENS